MPKISKSEDGTVLIEFRAGYKTVLIPSKDNKMAICLSSQIGCPVGCSFCRAGKFIRNLTVSEIMEQFKVGLSECGGITSVVFMGMGEPVLNLNAVNSAINSIHHDYGIAYRKITLSTSGVNLSELFNVPYAVAISLHNPFDIERKKIVPTAMKIKEVVDFSIKYAENRRWGVMIAYTLISGINDGDECLKELLSYSWDPKTNFNLIEFNEIGEYSQTPMDRINEWKSEIRDAGYKCFKRLARGTDIDAACGMLDYEIKC